MTGNLCIEKLGSVATVTLQRPHRRNALSEQLVVDLESGLLQLDADPNVACVVLAGAAPGFCAGSDLKELARMDVAGMSRHEAATARMVRLIPFLDVPIVAAVEGFALGGGFCLAAACDWVVCAPEARWHLPEVQIGWIPPWGIEPLVSRCGAVVARRLVWGCEPLDGTEAVRIGVADALAPIGHVLAAALERATVLAALPTVAVAATKRYFARHIAGLSEAMDFEAGRLFIDNCAHPAAKATLHQYSIATG